MTCLKEFLYINKYLKLIYVNKHFVAEIVQSVYKDLSG